MSQPRATGLWTEPAGGGGTPTVTGVALAIGAPGFVLTASVAPGGVFYDDGATHELVDLSAPLILTTNGAGGFTLATAGTAVGVIAEETSGAFAFTSDTTRVKALVFCPMQAQIGRYALVRPDGSDGLKMTLVGSTTHLYE